MPPAAVRLYLLMVWRSRWLSGLQSGRMPSKTKAWNFLDHFREPSTGAGWVSLPQYFLNHGYCSRGR